MRYLLCLFMLWPAAAPAADKEESRYEIVAAATGRPGVFRMDKVTGLISFCYWIPETQEINSLPAVVFCTPPSKR